MMIHALVVIGFILMVLGPCAIALYGRSGETVDEASERNELLAGAEPAQPGEVLEVKAVSATIDSVTAPAAFADGAPSPRAMTAGAPTTAGAALAPESPDLRGLSLEALVGSATAAVLLVDALAAHARAMSIDAGAQERKLREASELAEFAASSLRRSAEAIAAARLAAAATEFTVVRGPRAA